LPGVKTSWLFWLPAATWAGLIFWASARPVGPQPSWWFPHADKVIHAVLFGTLAGLVFLPLRAAHGWRTERAALLAFALTCGYGLTDEFHQRFTEGRTSDPLDAAADATGAGLAVACAVLLSRFVENQALSRRLKRD
jgi:VanZ family protein